MSNITSKLSEEHQIILQVIDAVIEECNNIENEKPINTEYFSQIISFIKNYADGYHHRKEEDILFKTMLKSVDCMHCNPIPVMLREHEEGRHFVRGMEDALASMNTKLLIENALGYCYLLQNHIYKEDNILYPMAEEALNENQKKQVEIEYAQVHVSDFFETDIKSVIISLTLAK